MSNANLEFFSIKTWKYLSPFNANSKEMCTKTMLEAYFQSMKIAINWKK